MQKKTSKKFNLIVHNDLNKIQNEINLVQFINLIPRIKRDLDSFEVVAIHQDDDKKAKFLKWHTSYDDGVCMNCGNCCDDEDECQEIQLQFYVDQYCTGEDSYHGMAVYPLTDCFVEVNYTC